MAVLVGDRERDRAALELQRHYREGRLTADELAQRLETALRARNGAQLRSALKELPAADRGVAEAVDGAVRRGDVRTEELREPVGDAGESLVAHFEQPVAHVGGPCRRDVATPGPRAAACVAHLRELLAALRLDPET